MKQSLLKLFVTAFVAATTAVGAMAQIPHDYYQSLKGKKGAELKTAIHNLVKEAYVLSYGSKDGSTWWGFYLTDNDNGKVIDRYSNETYMFGERGKSVSGTNIEHSFPKRRKPIRICSTSCPATKQPTYRRATTAWAS